VEKIWPHAPLHRLGANGTYMVTAATMYKEHLFSSPERLTLLETRLLYFAREYKWLLEAWAVFSNHYHFIARSQTESVSLRRLLGHLHADTARSLNVLDRTTGRVVWFNFWESRLTYQRSYLARLNYVHQNAVKHRLVPVANQYEWCSAEWFERIADKAMVETIYGMKIDQVTVNDNY
jgi:putative transposase